MAYIMVYQGNSAWNRFQIEWRFDETVQCYCTDMGMNISYIYLQTNGNFPVGEKSMSQFVYFSPRFSFDRMILPIGNDMDLSTMGQIEDWHDKNGLITQDIKAFKFLEANITVKVEMNGMEEILPHLARERYLTMKPNEYAFRQICDVFEKECVKAGKTRGLRNVQKMRLLLNCYGRYNSLGKNFLCFLAVCWYDNLFLDSIADKAFGKLPDALCKRDHIGFEDVIGFLGVFNAQSFFQKMSGYDCDNQGKYYVNNSEVELFLESYYACAPKTDFVIWSHNSDFTSGERFLASIFARLKNSLSDTCLPCVVFLDDVEMTLYPRDQRKLVKGFLEFFRRNFPERRFHLIFASASPVLLSDIPVGNVSIFEEERGESGNMMKADGIMPKLKVRKIANVLQPNTFGASIFELYSDFFNSTEGTIGEFASERINELLNDAEKVVNEEYEFGRIMQYVDSLHYKKTLVDLVGDDVIRHYLDTIYKTMEQAIRKNQ